MLSMPRMFSRTAAPPSVRIRIRSLPWSCLIWERVPSSTFFPLCIMKTESHICSAMDMSCVEKIMVEPLSRRSRMPRRMTSRLTGSRPEKGSSRMTSSGCERMVEMNWIFWAMPFERFSIFLLLQSAMSKVSRRR